MTSQQHRPRHRPHCSALMTSSPAYCSEYVTWCSVNVPEIPESSEPESPRCWYSSGRAVSEPGPHSKVIVVVAAVGGDVVVVAAAVFVAVAVVAAVVVAIAAGGVDAVVGVHVAVATVAAVDSVVVVAVELQISRHVHAPSVAVVDACILQWLLLRQQHGASPSLLVPPLLHLHLRKNKL